VAGTVCIPIDVGDHIAMCSNASGLVCVGLGDSVERIRFSTHPHQRLKTAPPGSTSNRRMKTKRKPQPHTKQTNRRISKGGKVVVRVQVLNIVGCSLSWEVPVEQES
jgi:hypothetical protein